MHFYLLKPKIKARYNRSGSYWLLLPAVLLSAVAAPLQADTPQQAATPAAPPPAAVSAEPAARQSAAEIETNTSVQSSTVKQMKERALQLEKSGKLEDAQNILVKAAEQNHEDRSLLVQLSRVDLLRAEYYLKKNIFQEALLSTRQALFSLPNNQEAIRMLSRLYKATGADPTSVNNRLKTAEALYNQGRYWEAEVEYQASLSLKVTAEAYVGLGKVAQKQKEPETDRACFGRALEIDANSANAHRELGLCSLTGGDIVSANFELSRALILNPADPEAGQALVKLWQDQVAKVPGANSHLGLARAYQLQGNLQAAQAEYRTVVQIDPQNPALPAARQSFKQALSRQKAGKSLLDAKALQSQGLLVDAYKKVCEAASYSPGNINCLLFQGELLEQLRQPVQARLIYLSILEFDPQNLLAIQKIKLLENALAARGQAPVFTGPAAVNSQVSGVPYNKFAPPGYTGASATTGNASETDQVNSLSNFIGSLRNYMQAKGSDPSQNSSYRPAQGLSSGSGGMVPSSPAAAPDYSARLYDSAAGARGNASAAIAAVRRSNGMKAGPALRSGAPGSSSRAPSAGVALPEQDRQNQMLNDQMRQLNDYYQNRQSSGSPADAGGLFLGRDFNDD